MGFAKDNRHSRFDTSAVWRTGTTRLAKITAALYYLIPFLTSYISSLVWMFFCFSRSPYFDWKPYVGFIAGFVLAIVFYSTFTYSICACFFILVIVPERMPSDRWWHIRKENVLLAMVSVTGLWVLAAVSSVREHSGAAFLLGVLAIAQCCFASYAGWPSRRSDSDDKHVEAEHGQSW